MRNQNTALKRVLDPDVIAVVGLRDGSLYLPYIEPTLDSNTEVHFVNPKHETVAGQRTYPDLTSIGKPIDAVYCATNASVAVEVVEEAAALDVGGVILVSAGYTEAGGDGEALQDRVRVAAETSGMAIIGPNGLGIVNVPKGVSLTIASPHKRRPGGLSVVSQSGALLSGVAMAAWERQIGLNVIVSAGNEAATDLADYVDFFAQDPGTEAIALVVEQVRRPQAFFDAVARARANGKPVTILKLARSERTQTLAASHTGALTGDAWVYDVALEQSGIAVAHDVEELVDRIAVTSQVSRRLRSAGGKLAVITATGGYASISMDIAEAEGIEVPDLDHLRSWVNEKVPGTQVVNPLDATPMGVVHWDEIVNRYASDDEVDAMMFVHPLAAEDDSESGRHMLTAFVDAGERFGKPVLISNCSGALGTWAQKIVEASPAAATGHGVRATIRGFASMRLDQQQRSYSLRGSTPPAIAAPSAPPVPSSAGPIATFSDSMRLLSDSGFSIAPFTLVDADDKVRTPEFPGPYAVKLAEVAHRTEYGAVRIGVDADQLPTAVREMRHIASAENLPSRVAVQQMASPVGEAFIGIQSSELGPVVVFGLGGVMIEVLRKVGGRMAPFTRTDAEGVIAEFESLRVMHGFRGNKPWNLAKLAELLEAAGSLAAGSRDWLESLDINPLIVTEDGFVVVDALCQLRDDSTDSAGPEALTELDDLPLSPTH